VDRDLGLLKRFPDQRRKILGGVEPARPSDVVFDNSPTGEYIARHSRHAPVESMAQQRRPQTTTIGAIFAGMAARDAVQKCRESPMQTNSLQRIRL
jgi:hypothetical protein